MPWWSPARWERCRWCSGSLWKGLVVSLQGVVGVAPRDGGSGVGSHW